MNSLKACTDVVECILNIFWQTHIIPVYSTNKLTDCAHFSRDFPH